MHGARKRRKANLERLRRHRRTNDPTYWRYEGGAKPSIVSTLTKVEFDGEPIPGVQRAVLTTEARNESGLTEREQAWANRYTALQRMGTAERRKLGARLQIKGCWTMRKDVLVQEIFDAEVVASSTGLPPA